MRGRWLLFHIGLACGAFLLAAVTYAFFGNGARVNTTQMMVAKPCPKSQECSATWTLTSRLGEILTFYEGHLGPRDKTYQLLGIELTEGGRPRTWYPDFGDGLKHIIVQIPARDWHNTRFTLFQLAHEAFHLMSPIEPASTASVLEEGLASYFANLYLIKIGKLTSGETMPLSEPHYRKALERVTALAGDSSDFMAQLKRLRARTRSFSRLTVLDLRSVFGELGQSDAQALIEPFGQVTAGS